MTRHRPIRLQRCDLDRLVHQRERPQDVAELVFGQSVQVRDQAIQFGAQAGTTDGIGHPVGVAAKPDFLCQVIEFRRGADELGGWLNDSDVPIRQGWGVAGVTVLPSP